MGLINQLSWGTTLYNYYWNHLSYGTYTILPTCLKGFYPTTISSPRFSGATHKKGPVAKIESRERPYLSIVMPRSRAFYVPTKLGLPFYHRVYGYLWYIFKPFCGI